VGGSGLLARHELDPARLPSHVALIMDGNGRWANRQGLKRNAGHEAGEAALFDTVEGALELGLTDLTVYAFSTENWRRPPSEVRFLLSFNESLLRTSRGRARRPPGAGAVHRPAVPSRPRRLVRLIEETEARRPVNRRLTLRIAFNYGAQAELVDAAQRLRDDVVPAGWSASTRRHWRPG
jgi:undecaprenyl diphosphate synthase